MEILSTVTISIQIKKTLLALNLSIWMLGKDHNRSS